MKLEEIIAMSTDYREDNRIKAYVFGRGKKAAAIIGAMRGNEYQQLYICSQLIRILTRLEERGAIVSGKQIMVIPSLNAHSSNIGKKYWGNGHEKVISDYYCHNIGLRPIDIQNTMYTMFAIYNSAANGAVPTDVKTFVRK